MPHVAKIQNVEQQWDETQRQQFARTLQEEAAHKKTQVQTSHRSESPEIHKKVENKKKRKRQSRRKRGEKAQAKAEAPEQENSSDEQHHIDFKI